MGQERVSLKTPTLSSCPAPGSPVMGDSIFSPSGLDFLDNLHTGLTPAGKKAKARSHLPVVEDALLGVGDSNWQPTGLDGFICERRAQRGKLPQTGKENKPVPGQKRVVERRSQLRHTQALFNKMDRRAEKLAAMDSTPRSMRSESEDEAAPIAEIPSLPILGEIDGPTIGRLFDSP